MQDHNVAWCSKLAACHLVGVCQGCRPLWLTSVILWTRQAFLQTYHKDIHTHPFNGPLSGTIQVSRYQKGKTNLDFTEARDSEWLWHQLGHMQIYT